MFLQCVLLVWSGYVHSPTHLEVFHLPAGLSHLELNRYDLFRVNPPLIRKFAALPMFLSSHSSNYHSYNTNPLFRAEYSVGLDTMYSNGSRFIWFIILSRWACIPFILLGSFICFIWARQLYGEVAGIISMLLWVFCPYTLAQGSLITPDAHAAALGAATAFLFWKWLKKPTYLMALFVGITLGIAELSKFTLLIFYPLGFILWLIFRFSLQKNVMFARLILRELAMIILIAMMSIFVINFGYDFECTFEPLGNYKFQTTILTGCQSIKDIPPEGANRFNGTLLAGIPVPLPSNFVAGIDLQRKDVETGIFSYLNGEWKLGGWWYFYLEALLIKLPVGTLMLVFLCIIVTIYALFKEFRRFKGYSLMRLFSAVKPAVSTENLSTNRTEAIGYLRNWRDEIFLLLPVFMILFIFSAQDGIGVHSRYLMPMLPFLFIWSSKVAMLFRESCKVLSCLIIVFLSWSILSTLYSFPHEISYCNELFGGSKNTYKYLATSDSSWGQDLLFLKKWLDLHPEAVGMRIAHCGPFDPRLAGLEFTTPPVGRNNKKNYKELPIEPLGPQVGWYAIDVCFLLGGDPLSASDGKGGWVEPSGILGYDLSYFQEFKPVAQAGRSIYIYYINQEDANRVRRKMNLPEINFRK